MLLADPQQLRAAVPPGRRIMGLDVGTRTIGLALSDTRLIIASPLETIRRRRFAEDIAALFALIDRHEIAGLVIGLPLSLGGGDSPRTQSVRQFARNLLALRDIPVALWDERLSTAAVTREMIAHDMTRKRRAEIVDRVAAAYILQGFLDATGRAAITVVTISAPWRCSRRIAVSLLSARREPTASRTSQTRRPASIRPSAVCNTQTCVSQPTTTRSGRSGSRSRKPGMRQASKLVLWKTGTSTPSSSSALVGPSPLAFCSVASSGMSMIRAASISRRALARAAAPSSMAGISRA